MKKIISAAVILAAQPASAGSGAPGLELSGYISSWTQECPGGACSG